MGIFRTKKAAHSLRGTVVLLVVCCLLLLSFAVAYLLDPYGFRMAPGVSIGQVDISGMSLPSAIHTLEQALEDTLYSQALTVQFPEETLSLSPGQTNPKVSSRQAAWDAYGLGRWKETDQTRLSLESYLTVEESSIRDCLTDYALSHDTTLTESTWSLEGTPPKLGTAEFDAGVPCQTLTVTLGYPEAKLDVEAAFQAIYQALCNAPGGCKAGQYTVSIGVTPTSLPKAVDISVIAQAVSVEAVSDSLSMETYSLVPGSYGLTFDAAKLAQLLAAAVPGETVSVPMEAVTPEIIGDQVYFRDLLGSCDTRHTNNENRNTNLRLLCQALDGFILQPGEEFSYNGVVGERTSEKGYKPAPAYSGNRLVDSIGGGVCQGSTTLYNCVLLADLEVVFRACHGASVGYVPRGLDAAVNYLTTDFKFRNNWNFPIKIQAEVSDGYVKMQILGTDEKDYYIKMESLSGEDEIAVYSRSYKCKYSKETDELISREIEAYSTYYKNIG